MRKSRFPAYLGKHPTGESMLTSILVRDEFESHRQSHIERQRRLQEGITENGFEGSIRSRRRQHKILRAPEVLLALAGKTLKSMDVLLVFWMIISREIDNIV